MSTLDRMCGGYKGVAVKSVVLRERPAVYRCVCVCLGWFMINSYECIFCKMGKILE